MAINRKPPLFIQQSGVIPYRILDGEIEIMVITSSTGKRWVIPKGLVEPDMTPQDSAAKEAWEEAGLIGNVLPTLLGTYEYQKWGRICRVEVFLLQVEIVLESWPEAKKRKREWVSLAKAVKRVEEAELKRILTDLTSML
ncbi:NUDIX hydrolase [Kamptonema animale CS-326]|jgi:8-oxo-dGTP pyrophosphatase MutT (NUDIX family)|uniref:NUDIX hydrolase n=1 Tax=Kamptonema TaxID=1501433 RepID=UPI0001DAC6AA|nr:MULTISPECIES: NUDIX hydrolase [Kamptonema]MDB9512245.1 NUDIX hydrolase [Kamptonema animale CS-326]CBN55491.1 NUDIX hydrolase [Kamptonema sp. PCC 6506]